MKKFITLLPPPNITGSLHIGHYFNWLIQDFVLQHKKKQGYETEWILGLDHAGIATQYVVEKKLKAEEKKTREEIGKEKFNEKIWAWKEEAESLIQTQVNNFKFEMNWEKRHFTMNEAHQKKVKEAFIKFYEDGLIEKKLRITNWDTKCETAISDLEVIEKVEKGKIYLIEYKSANGSKSIKVATTRPETIFADVALCVNPEDERYKHLKGEKFLIPIINKEIPVIYDKLCEKTKGLGVLKVTPAHDTLDYEIGENHNLELVSIIDKQGRLYNTIEELNGLKVEEAKKAILKIFEEKGVNFEEKEWEGIKKYTEKSNIPVETILTEQWFLDVSSMAKEAIKQSQEVKFYPEYLREVFNSWMKNIKPWCISRQIWWGHQIPIYYTEKGKIICAATKEEAQKQAPNENLTEETDVLDTWFSSALWANLTEEKIDLLATGKDILFFWVARMIMFSLYLYKKNPFKTLYFNGIVRDKNNEKMSKTKGNVINPLEINEKYGDDALRFTLLKNTAGNKDIKLNEKEVELSRNFITKIKNASTFIKEYMKQEDEENESLNNWIEKTIAEHKIKIEKAIEVYDFQKAADLFYNLTWNEFCNWYIEGLKVNPSAKAMGYFETILEIGEPFLPLTIKSIRNSQKDLKFSERIFSRKNQQTKLDRKEDPALVPKKEKNSFKKTIKITQFLRQLKQLGGAENIGINYDKKLILHYTKLKENLKNPIQIEIEEEKIQIEKESLENLRKATEKAVNTLKNDIKDLENKLKTAKNVKKEALKDWENRIINKNNELAEQQQLMLIIMQ